MNMTIYSIDKSNKTCLKALRFMGSLTALNAQPYVCKPGHIYSHGFSRFRFMDNERFKFDMEMWRFAWLNFELVLLKSNVLHSHHSFKPENNVRIIRHSRIYPFE